MSGFSQLSEVRPIFNPPSLSCLIVGSLARCFFLWDLLTISSIHRPSTILFQIHNKLPASLEINSQRTATCLVHAFVFLEGLPTITSIVEGFGVMVVCRLMCTLAMATHSRTFHVLSLHILAFRPNLLAHKS